MNCKNCGNSVNGKFCSNCGQNSTVGRVTFPTISREVSESVFQVNKGFFYTLKELFIRPGNNLKDYLIGKRKRHFKPIAYVLTLSTLYFLITQITHQNTWMDDIMNGWMNGATEQNSDIEIPNTLKWFSKNYAYTTLILLPVFSLASYISYYKFGKNYFEHIVLNSYITGQQAIIYSLFAIAGIFFSSVVIEILPIILAISYTFWVFNQFFSEGNRAMNTLRSMSTYILYLVFSFGLLGILVGFTE